MPEKILAGAGVFQAWSETTELWRLAVRWEVEGGWWWGGGVGGGSHCASVTCHLITGPGQVTEDDRSTMKETGGAGPKGRRVLDW